jgi:hypothetical protein
MHANGAYGSYATRTADFDPKSAWWMSYRPSQGTWITSDYPELVGYPDNSQPQIDAYAMHN